VEEKNGGEIRIMENKMKDQVKKKEIPLAPTLPKFSQRQMRGMERIRMHRPMTPMLTRVRRKEIMEEFFKEKKKHEKLYL